MAVSYNSLEYETTTVSSETEILEFCMEQIGIQPEDLQYIGELSPYLILDGHRTGVKNQLLDTSHGYVEGAKFSMRFAKIFQKIGGKQVTFLIHTLRNYATMDRMNSIFSAVEDIGKKFIFHAEESGIKLRYYGKDVRTSYFLADLINQAEIHTRDCQDFSLNFLTNYSEEWANQNIQELDDLPNINVIGRFTKGHYSGAGIPGHADRSNFMYIQQASVSENWTDQEIIVLILSLLKAHLALKGYVGGKQYLEEERELIRQNREENLFEDVIKMTSHPHKRLTSFTPHGPLTVYF